MISLVILEEIAELNRYPSRRTAQVPAVTLCPLSHISGLFRRLQQQVTPYIIYKVYQEDSVSTVYTAPQGDSTHIEVSASHRS